MLMTIMIKIFHNYQDVMAGRHPECTKGPPTPLFMDCFEVCHNYRNM